MNDCAPGEHTCANNNGGVPDEGGIDLFGANNFWDGKPYIGLGGGNFGGIATLTSVLPPYTIETDAANSGDPTVDIGGTFGSWDFLTYFLAIPQVSGDNNGGNSSGTVRATRKLKFKPPSWDNFIHQFLPCYGAHLADHFIGNDTIWVTGGTIALTVKKPVLGGSLFLVWTGVGAFKAGSVCTIASRGVYE
jgi:hypothetical protein